MHSIEDLSKAFKGYLPNQASILPVQTIAYQRSNCFDTLLSVDPSLLSSPEKLIVNSTPISGYKKVSSRQTLTRNSNDQLAPEENQDLVHAPFEEEKRPLLGLAKFEYVPLSTRKLDFNSSQGRPSTVEETLDLVKLSLASLSKKQKTRRKARKPTSSSAKASKVGEDQIWLCTADGPTTERQRMTRNGGSKDRNSRHLDFEAVKVKVSARATKNKLKLNGEGSVKVSHKRLEVNGEPNRRLKRSVIK